MEPPAGSFVVRYSRGYRWFHTASGVIFLFIFMAGAWRMTHDPAWTMDPPPNKPHPIIYVTMGLVFGLTPLLVTWSFGAHVDAEGVTVRTLLWLRRRYLWSEFASGALRREGELGDFAFPAAGKKRRLFRLRSLEKAGAQRLLDECLRHWVPPLPPPVPKRVLAVMRAMPAEGRPSRVRVLFDAEGLTFPRDPFRGEYRWRDVQELSLLRTTLEHSDFVYVELSVGVVRLCDLGSAASSRQLPISFATTFAAFLLEHVPPERVRTCAVHGPARNLEEADMRRRWVAAIERSERWRGWGMAAMLLPIATKMSVDTLIQRHYGDFAASCLFVALGVAFLPVLPVWRWLCHPELYRVWRQADQDARRLTQ